MLDVKAISKRYGNGPDATVALEDLTFNVDDGEFVCVVGPSGCGKTTLLKCVSGLMAPTSGSVHLRGVEVHAPPKGLALVFQEYGRSLLPWLTVRANVALPLRRLDLPKQEQRERVEEAVEAVNLLPFIDKHPWQLSGGMQQRVAIARALAYQPEILLMDEPFASVDAQTRSDLEDFMLQVRERYSMTILFVTHDIDESVYLADRIVVLSSPPTHVRAVLSVELSSPRDQITTKSTPEFMRLRSDVYGLIKRERAPEAALARKAHPGSATATA